MKWLLSLTGLGLLAAYVAAGKKLSKLELQPVALSLDKKNSNLQYSVLNLTISIYNPSDSPVKIDKFIGTIYYNNSRVSDLDPQKLESQIIPGRGEKQFVYTVKIKNTSIPGALYSFIFENKTASKEAIIKGTLKAENMSLPIEEKVSLTA